MGKDKFLCETKQLEYYNTPSDEIYFIRKVDGSKSGPSLLAESSLVNDMLNKKVTRIFPDFVYEYVEILENNGENLYDFCGVNK